MNTITKTVITIEHHCLHLPYASLRLQKRQNLERLVISIEKVGQLVPVIVVPKGVNEWILMDGHQRVNALRRMGKDIVYAEAWNCDVATALLMLLTEHQSPTWIAFEEALLLQELHLNHGLSQEHLAKQMGRDQSWISRRLSLIELLPEPVLQAVKQGRLSLWSATRIFMPMARAIPAHAELLLQYVLKCTLSTRELKCFYDRYQQSTLSQRLNMVNNPDLFFKAHRLMLEEKKAHSLQIGLEGKWHSQLQDIHESLSSLISIASQLFLSYQDTQASIQLLHAFQKTQNQWNLLTEIMRNVIHDHQRNAADHHQSAPERP